MESGQNITKGYAFVMVFLKSEREIFIFLILNIPDTAVTATILNYIVFVVLFIQFHDNYC